MNQQFTLFLLTFAHAEFRRDARRTLDNFAVDGRWRQGGGLWPPVRATPIREELAEDPFPGSNTFAPVAPGDDAVVRPFLFPGTNHVASRPGPAPAVLEVPRNCDVCRQYSGGSIARRE